MRLVRIFLRRVYSLVRSSRAESELEREIDIHIEQLTRTYVAAGMSEPEARMAARRDFGPVELTKEQCRDKTHPPQKVVHRLMSHGRYMTNAFLARAAGIRFSTDKT